MQPMGLPLWVTWGQSGGVGESRVPTMFVSSVDGSAQVQEALQAWQALRFLAGQVQGAAFMDLWPEHTWGWRRRQQPHDPCPQAPESKSGQAVPYLPGPCD